MADKKNNESKQKKASYKVEDAMKIADEILKLSNENKYNVGAFIHGLVFTLEYAIYSYNVPQQQIAAIKRDCRNYLKEMEKLKQKQE